MNSIQGFSLKTRGDESSKSCLFYAGIDTGRVILGLEIVKQYSLSNKQFLLVTDYGDPWEELTEIMLLDEKFCVLARARLGSIGTAFVSKTYSLKDIRWLSEREFLTVPNDERDGSYRCVIRSFGIPLVYPRLHITPV
jgi:hypothetical protein